MQNEFQSMPPGLESPAGGGFAITPTDATDLAYVTRAVYVGGAGNLAVTLLNGNTVTFVAVPAGTILPIRATIIASTNTTATNIVGLY